MSKMTELPTLYLQIEAENAKDGRTSNAVLAE